MNGNEIQYLAALSEVLNITHPHMPINKRAEVFAANLQVLQK